MIYDAASAPTAINRSVSIPNGSGTPALPLVHSEQPQGFGSHLLKVGAVPVSPLVSKLYTIYRVGNGVDSRSYSHSRVSN